MTKRENQFQFYIIYINIYNISIYMSLYILCHLSQLSHYYQRRHRETLWLHYKKLLSICSNMFLFMENIYLCGKIKTHEVFMRDIKNDNKYIAQWQRKM